MKLSIGHPLPAPSPGETDAKAALPCGNPNDARGPLRGISSAGLPRFLRRSRLAAQRTSPDAAGREGNALTIRRSLAPVLRIAAMAVLLGASGAQAAPGTTTDLLTFIRAIEAPRGHDDFERRIRIPPPKRLTRMTVGEVLDWQSRVRNAGGISTAAGGYQLIHPTLERLVRTHGLDRDALFDAAMQDRLARLLIAECGDPGPPSRHPRFADCLAGIWAALPMTSGPQRGRSAYEGVAGNRALVRPETLLAVLSGRSVRLPRNIPEHGAPAVADEAVLAFGAVRLSRISTAMRDAAQADTLTPSVRNWSFDPYAVD